MEMKNFTPFSNIRYINSDSNGKEFGVVIVKMAFDINEDGTCILSREQEPLLFSDECYGELNASSLRYPSDLVPYKPATDVLVGLVAKAPCTKPISSWLCHIAVEDEFRTKIEKTIRVTGPRWWVPKWKRALNDDERRNWKKYLSLFAGWELSEPEPIVELPIRYEYAFGGLMPKGLDRDGKEVVAAFEYNPVGRGWIDKDWTDHTKPVAAPQIEDVSDPISNPYETYQPQGFGPIPPAWLPRRPLGGTYDQDWMEKVWPQWPADYQFSYHNSAANMLRGPDGQFIDGQVSVTLTNASEEEKTRKVLSFNVPSILVQLSDKFENIKSIRINFDTIHIKLDVENPLHKQIYVSGRAVFEVDKFEIITIHQAQGWMNVNGVHLRDLFPASPDPSEVV
ncbi:DUF2169 domain-containing protein [Labrys sp. KB_33_2]|uniref:DUF2169 family type VI secretion system accessory protein n=1 Tax=unclassified Labrys (in: a-proteobacteria) TaxID=2688601 RepID=UPI003EB8F3CA